jgi:hypothetical protein
LYESQNSPPIIRLPIQTNAGGRYERKKSLKKAVEDTMACSAFAEAGEPCPIGTEKSDKKTPKQK